jgi:hypothetical protein
MNSTMTSPADTGNPERLRMSASATFVQVSGTLNDTAGTTTAHAGFIITDRDGEFLVWAACILPAMERFRDLAQADRVTRCSDGALMCFRRSRKKAPGQRWTTAVPL